MSICLRFLFFAVAIASLTTACGGTIEDIRERAGEEIGSAAERVDQKLKDASSPTETPESRKTDEIRLADPQEPEAPAASGIATSIPPTTVPMATKAVPPPVKIEIEEAITVAGGEGSTETPVNEDRDPVKGADEKEESLTLTMDVAEAITVTESIVSLLSVALVVNEQIKVADEPEASVVGQANVVLNISEIIQVIDNLQTLGSVSVTVTELVAVGESIGVDPAPITP